MINLYVYLENTYLAIREFVCSKFGLDTFHVISKGIKEFDFDNYNKNQSLCDMMYNFITEQTPISDRDIFTWFTGDNQCVDYISNMLKLRVINVSDNSFNIMDAIKNAQNTEIYNAFFSVKVHIKQLLFANYLIKMGYKQICPYFFIEFIKNYNYYDELDFDLLFTYTLAKTNYTQETCGTRT